MATSYSIKIGQKKTDVFDLGLILSVLGLMTVGLLSIYSATHDSTMSAYFTKQINSALIGIAIASILVFIPQNIIIQGAPWVYGLSILALVYVLVNGIEIYGTKGWIKIGGSTFQPAELAKLGTMMMLGRYFLRKGVEITNLRDIIIVMMIILLPVGLIMAQPDAGSATVLLAMLLGILFWSGFNSMFLFTVVTSPIVIIASLKGPIYFYVILAILSAMILNFDNKITSKVAIIALFFSLGLASPIIFDNLMPHQQARINTFINPGTDPRGTGYNVMQSLLAVGSGGVVGKGFMQGTQTQLRYIPMQWTDFIYSVPTEEFGFVGGVIVIGLMLTLILRALDIAKISDNKFFSIVAVGSASIFLYHTLINIGMVIGLMPVMGIPLPFMSYGGTSIITNLIIVGLLLNSYRTIKLKKRAI